MPDALRAEASRYRRAAVLGALLLLIVFGIGSALQSTIFQVARGLPAYDEIYAVPVWARLLANLAAVAIIVVSVWLLPIHPRRRVLWMLAAVGATVVAVLTRGALQLALEVYPIRQLDLVLVDVVVGLFSGLFSMLVGVILAEALERARAQERAASRQTLRARSALDALQTEELRVRREVAEGLHGTVQQRLVLIGARVRRAVADLPVGAVIDSDDLRRLEEVHQEIDELREQGVRGMSQLLYPEGIDIGLVPAVRMMLRRVPSAIRVDTEIEAAVAEFDDPGAGRISAALRLLSVRLLEEAVSNALRHGHAGRIAVTLRLDDGERLTMCVDDDGVGIPEHATLSGLAQLRNRLDDVGGTLDLGRSHLGGARVLVTFPAQYI